jgi:hypothetical protein
MFALKFAGCAAAAAIASVISIGATHAAMSPIKHYGETPPVHHVDCAVGFHIGPAGGCVIGTDDAVAPPPPPDRPVVIERRATDEGCQTRSVKRENSFGDSETHTQTDCD